MCLQKKNLVSVLLGAILLLCAITARAETTRIAIFPFDLHASENIEFMQDGIFEMLANRFTANAGHIGVIPRAQMMNQMASAPSDTLEDKFALAKSLGADYFVSGSLTAFGNQISTDARFFNTRKNDPLIRFSETGTQHGDVIQHIDRFASLVNQKLLKKAGGTSGPLPVPRQIQTPSATDTPSLEKPTQDGTDTASSSSGLVVAREAAAGDRWQSNAFQTHLKGLSVGDVDGDGTNECVFIDKNRAYIYRFEKDHFVKIAEFHKSRHHLFLSVDVADVNGNGKAEIFITNYAKLSERPTSFIVEYTASGFRMLAENANWYYRVFRESNSLPVLVGQKQVADDESKFKDGIQVLAFQNDGYVRVDTVKPPKDLTIYEMTFAENVKETGRIFVGYVRNNEIAALSAGGETLWNSNQEFNGSLNYFEYADRQSVDTARHYISKRILLADTDNNGNQEVIAVRNINSVPGFMTKIRRYKRGYISCLEWDDTYVLRPKWKTIEEQGYISDVAIADVTNDGKADLVFSVVKDAASKRKASSYLVIQQLP